MRPCLISSAAAINLFPKIVCRCRSNVVSPKYGDNAILQKQQNINRYVHAYFSDNDEVMMEQEGIDLMFSDENLKPMPINAYREYMKERKKEAKDKTNAGKRK